MEPFMTAHAAQARFVETTVGRLPVSVVADARNDNPPTGRLEVESAPVSPPATGPMDEPGFNLAATTGRWMSIVVPPLIVVATMLVVWEIACSGAKASLPPPSKIWVEARDLIVDPFFFNGPQDIGLGWRVLTSLQRVAVGFGLAALAGIMLGALVGQSQWAMRGLDPVFQVLRTISPLAWLPISLAAFRDAHPSAIFVIFITAIWPIIINTAVGIRNIPQDYRNVAAVLRLNHAEFFWRIMIPSAAPYIFTGLRIGIGLSWLAIVAAEMLTGGVGIGFFIWDAWNSSRLPDIVVALVYIGLIGFVLDRLVASVGYIATRGTQTS
jgi:nitrate/nitrite transport system permease protein